MSKVVRKTLADSPMTSARKRKLAQVAARPDSEIDLAPDQPRKSGLGLLKYIENWNEPDRTWNDRQGRFHPYELAAMCSADYDGHKSALGSGHGVKTADPNMKLVLAGLAGLDLPYLKAMKLWADYNRGGSFPADVINLHHYSSNGNEQGFKPDGHGISPEADKLKERMQAIAEWRNANVPDAELWLTEFGYDTNPTSPLHAPAIGSMNAERVQAAWLVRSYLALAAAGVDRAAMFMLRDVKSTDGGVFATCGLVTEKGQWKPKPSWFYLAALKKRLNGLTFDKEIPSGNPDVLVYRFGNSVRQAYVVWCPTSEDKHVKGFNLKLPGKTMSGVLPLIAADDKFHNAGFATPVPTGVLKLDVSETPTIVTVPSK